MTEKIVSEIDSLPLDNLISFLGFTVYPKHWFNILAKPGSLFLVFSDHSGKQLFYDLNSLSLYTKTEFIYLNFQLLSPGKLLYSFEKIKNLDESQIRSLKTNKPIDKDLVLATFFEFRFEITSQPLQEEPSSLVIAVQDFINHFEYELCRFYFSKNGTIFMVVSSPPDHGQEGEGQTEHIFSFSSYELLEAFPTGKPFILNFSSTWQGEAFVFSNIGKTLKSKSYLNSGALVMVNSPAFCACSRLGTFDSLMLMHSVVEMSDALKISLFYLQAKGFMAHFEIVDRGRFFQVSFFNCPYLADYQVGSFSRDIWMSFKNNVLDGGLSPRAIEVDNKLSKLATSDYLEDGATLMLLKNYNYFVGFFDALSRKYSINIKWVPDV